MADDAGIDFLAPLRAEAEDLEIEFKQSLPLADAIGKAKLAKEICALANHGGGWIVLGRRDDGTFPENLPEELVGADQDTINQISAAYLSPAPHCAVRWAQPADVSFEVLVVRVPTVGTAPVCGRKNGPNDANGKTVGIRKGLHYIRKAGPVSGPIESADEWQAVIRKCVLSDKAALLGALTTMMTQPSPTPDQEGSSIMDVDFAHMIETWRDKVAKKPYDVDLTSNFVAYSFHLLDGPTVIVDQIIDCLHNGHREFVGAHRFFDVGYPAPNNPIVIENAGVDGIEVDLTTAQFDLKAAWRLSEVLSGTEVVSFWEDTEWIKSAVEGRSSRTWERGKKIWIDMQIGFVSNFLENAKHVADYFKYDGKIRIRVEYHGLKGRTLGSPSFGVYYSRDYEAHQDIKKIDITIDKDALDAEARSATISAIVQTMNKLTQGPAITPERVVKGLEALAR
jgi:hypothetical protein